MEVDLGIWSRLTRLAVALLCAAVVVAVGVWYKPQIAARRATAIVRHPDAPSGRRVKVALVVLVLLLFSKQLYVSSLSSYYIFYLIDRFGTTTVMSAGVVLMLLGVVAALSGMSEWNFRIALTVNGVGWNFLFNQVFEAWETRQTVRGRSLRRRIVHAIGFEGGAASIGGGAASTVGAGAAVIRDVREATTVAGCPAREIQRDS